MARNLFKDVMSNLCIFWKKMVFGIPKKRITWK